MEIRVKTPIQSKLQKRYLNVDRNAFISDLTSFIDKIENQHLLDKELKQKLLNYGIDESEFEKMIEEISVWSDYNENHDEIGFPYENWIDRLLTIYE